jgi:ribosomal protein S14
MRSRICRDAFLRKVTQKRQISRKLLGFQGYLDSFVFINPNAFSYRCYWSFSGYGCLTKVRKRCFVSGRGRGVRVFGLSRHDLRRLINVGFVNGLFRATW